MPWIWSDELAALAKGRRSISQARTAQWELLPVAYAVPEGMGAVELLECLAAEEDEPPPVGLAA